MAPSFLGGRRIFKHMLDKCRKLLHFQCLCRLKEEQGNKLRGRASSYRSESESRTKRHENYTSRSSPKSHVSETVVFKKVNNVS